MCNGNCKGRWRSNSSTRESPEAAKAPATVIPAVATTAALAVMGEEEAAKVVTALTVSVSEDPDADPMTVLPCA